jgi:TRAP-type C4-dicarboxylate transport system substrate-binding protein
MLRRDLLAGLAGATAISAGLPGTATAQTRWQFATPYPDGNFHTINLRAFVKDIEDAAPGKLGIQVHSNGSLLRMPEIRRGVQTGQAQLGEILLSAYGNEDPFLEVDGLPMLVVSFEQARILNRLQKPYVEARLARQGITLLYMVPWPQSGLYSNVKLDSLEQLRGTKFRTYNAVTQRFATLLGATPTLVQVPELPQAFATGVVNAMVTSAATGVDAQAWDFVKNFVPVGFTRTKNAVFVNTRAFQSLPADVQAVVKAQATKAEERGWAAAAKEEADKQAVLVARGMQVTDPPPPALITELQKVGDTLVTEWVGKAGEDGAKLIADYKAAVGRA